MAATGIPIPVWSLIAASGAPVSGAKLYSFVPSSSGAPTATPRALYTDPAATTPAANPYSLGTNGGGTLYRLPSQSCVIQIKSADEATTYSTVHFPADLNQVDIGDDWPTVLEADYLGETWIHWFGDITAGATAFTDALRAAIASLPYPFGGVVRIPAGSYTMNKGTANLATMLVTRGVTVQGMGRDVTTIALSSDAYFVLGGSGASVDATKYAFIKDLQITAQNSATNAAIVADRASRCGVHRVLIAGNDYHGIDFGTSANPSLTAGIECEDVEILCDAANSSGAYLWGGGSHRFINFVTQGTSGQGQTALDINNTSDIDTLIIHHGGTGDCDYGFRWRGSANLSNVFANGAGWDRSASGAIVAAPAGTAAGSDWIFEGIYAAGVGSTTGIDGPAIFFSVGSGRSLVRVKLSGLVKDSRTELMKVEGDGTVADLDIAGLAFADGARAATNTYPAFRDATTSGITRLIISGCTISATASTYSYGIRVDTIGSGTNLKDIINNNVSGGASGDIYFGGAVLSCHLGNNGKKWTDIASATTTNLAGATGDYGDVTGTTTITGLGTAPAGVERTVNFTGALTLTHNATSLILPTGANITTAAGDVAMFRSLGSGNWKCVNYIRASGVPLTDALLVHQAGTESITGTKTFTPGVLLAGMTVTTAAASKASQVGAIADDAVATVVTLTAGGSHRLWGVSTTGYHFDCQIETVGTASITLISGHIDVTVTAAASDPTGTTGTDTKLNIYLNTSTRAIVIENRLGASLTPTVKLLTNA